MKGIAIFALLLLVGCAPVTQRVESAAPNVQFVARVNGPELSYTAYVFVSEAMTIRRIALKAEDFVSDDLSCEPWDGVEHGVACGVGAKVPPSPSGYRLNFEAVGEVRGNVCMQRPDREVLFCRNLVFMQEGQ